MRGSAVQICPLLPDKSFGIKEIAAFSGYFFACKKVRNFPTP